MADVMPPKGWRKALKTYTIIYLSISIGWLIAWPVLGLGVWFSAHVPPAAVIFFQFVWMPFGVIQMLIVSAAMKREIAFLEGLSAEIAVAALRHQDLVRTLVFDQYGIELPSNRPTIQ